MFKRLIVPVLVGLSILPLQASAWVHYHGGGFVHGPRGGAAMWHRGGWGVHGAPVFHGAPPVVHGAPPPPVHPVRPIPPGRPAYHGGCWGCAPGAAAAAGAVGLAAGAAIGSAAAASAPTTVIQQPVYVASPTIGSTVLTLPSGCTSAMVNGVRYYGCGGTYYKPHFGSNSVYYTVVPNPF
jgi:hypothetical protein